MIIKCRERGTEREREREKKVERGGLIHGHRAPHDLTIAETGLLCWWLGTKVTLVQCKALTCHAAWHQVQLEEISK